MHNVLLHYTQKYKEMQPGLQLGRRLHTTDLQYVLYAVVTS